MIMILSFDNLKINIAESEEWFEDAFEIVW